MLLLARPLEEEQPPPGLALLSRWEVGSAVGVKYCRADIFLLWNMDASLVWACACLCMCIRVRLTGGQRSLCRHRLGSTPALGKEAAVSLSSPPCPIPSLCSSSSSSSSCHRDYSPCAGNTQGAMWCGSVLSSGLSTVCVCVCGGGGCVGSEQRWRQWKSLTSSQVSQVTDEPDEFNRWKVFPCCWSQKIAVKVASQVSLL